MLPNSVILGFDKLQLLRKKFSLNKSNFDTRCKNSFVLFYKSTVLNLTLRVFT